MAKPAIMNADEIGERLSESIRTLARLQGFSEQTVTLAECGVILKTCAGRTKVAKPDATDNTSRKRALRKLGLLSAEPGEISINAGIRGAAGFVWLRTTGPHPRSKTKGGGKIAGRPFKLAGVISSDGSKFTPSKFHFAPTEYFKIKGRVFDAQAAIQKAIPLGQRSAGLARQSWVQIADDLGIILEDVPGGGASPAAISKARRAIASNGRTYINGIGTANYVENKSFVASLKNSLPYNVKASLDQVLISTLAGRAKFFEQNVARGVFDSQAETVKKYPWLKIVGAPAGAVD